MTKIAVLGAGSWGSALAMVLAENGHNVRLWTHDAQHAQELQQTRQNPKYLKDFTLPETIQVTADLSQAVVEAEMINFVIPTKAMRSVAQAVRETLGEIPFTQWPIVMHASKGIEQGTYLRISELLQEALGVDDTVPMVVLSGPSHAEEVARHDITAITAASQNDQAAHAVQSAFMNDYFRVYTNADIVGVEWGGALKNIIAIGAGILAGLGFGDNAKAALVTRGLAEITRLGIQLGAEPLTFMGLSGVGDLIVTTTSVHSRNWRAGYQMGQGKAIDQIEADMGMVVEGMSTTIACYDIAQQRGVEMPITQAIYRIIKENADPSEEIKALMQRDKKAEIYTMPLQGSDSK